MSRVAHLWTVTAAMGAIVICGCGDSVAAPAQTPTPTQSQAETAAANLRIRADQLFGEHTFTVAKLAVAAAGGRHDEFRSYAGLLAANGGDLETLLRMAAGQTAGAQFGDAWSEENNLLVNYIVASVTRDQAGAASAAAGLTGTSVPQLTTALEAGESIPAEEATKLASDEALGLKLVIDDATGAAYTKLYADVAEAHTRAIALADAVSVQIARQYHDRFPGDLAAKAAEFRAGMSSLLQREAYLLTMSSDAAAVSTAADVHAVETVLTANAQAMSSLLGSAFGEVAGTQLATVWSQEANLVVAYTKGGDPAIRQSMLNRAAPPLGVGTVYGPDLTEAITALLAVVDEQRAKRYANLATDDRTAATAMAATADAISAEAKL